ncbi:MAG TPA: IS256 family transposase, partial [Porticoccaceae bacterium]|nr:IS256 family transposase [Porticoccaceae bacterium]
MKESKVVALENPEQTFDHALDRILRDGARKMLQEAIKIEVDQFLQDKASERTPQGHQKIVRNGYQPEREVLSGVGKLKIQQPRLRYREEPSEKFTSSILPRYMRRSPSLDALIPALYLRGVSSGNFSGALEAILGRKVKGMSSNTVVRLKEKWAKEYGQWGRRDLSNKQYIYWWADGIHFNVRWEEQRTCILVVIGVLEDGTKELVAVADGYRESTESWLELLRNLKA